MFLIFSKLSDKQIMVLQSVLEQGAVETEVEYKDEIGNIYAITICVLRQQAAKVSLNRKLN